MTAPHLRKYSATSPHSLVITSSSDYALVKHSSNDYPQSRIETPQQLIHNESISTLIGEVDKLRQRCDSLEEANMELRDDIRAMKEMQAATLAQQHAQTQPLHPSKHLNLSGYPSSESSDSSEPPVFGGYKDPSELFTTVKHDFANYKSYIDAKVDTMTEILKAFQSDLNAEGVARFKLGQELERAKHDATKTTGRLGAAETSVKECRGELDELSDSIGALQYQTSSGVTHPESAVSGKGDEQLAAALVEIEDLAFEVKHQAGLIDSLQIRVDASAASPASDSKKLTAADYAGRISNVHSTAQSPDFMFMQHAVHTMTQRAEMQQKIDDMCSKDQLHVAYAQLTRGLETAPSDDATIITADSFSGTYHELFSLRDRVVRRLTTIDKYSQAMQEAKDAEVYL